MTLEGLMRVHARRALDALAKVCKHIECLSAPPGLGDAAWQQPQAACSCTSDLHMPLDGISLQANTGQRSTTSFQADGFNQSWHTSGSTWYVSAAGMSPLQRQSVVETSMSVILTWLNVSTRMCRQARVLQCRGERPESDSNSARTRECRTSLDASGRLAAVPLAMLCR